MLIVAIVSILLVVAPMNAEVGQLLFNYFHFVNYREALNWAVQKMAESIEMQFGYGLGWAQGSMY